MKLALDYKRLHLRFFCGTGFVLFILRKKIARDNGEDARKLKSAGKQIKKLLKDYKQKNGAFNLVEIESEGTRIVIKV